MHEHTYTRSAKVLNDLCAPVSHNMKHLFDPSHHPSVFTDVETLMQSLLSLLI